MDQFTLPFFKNSLLVTQSERGILEISFQKPAVKSSGGARSENQQVREHIRSYLAGERQDLGIPIDWQELKGTEFQKKVWKQMLKIPYGKTKTYSMIAKSLRSPGAARAVGTACAKNPVLLAIPCHRVVGVGGLGGFSGGGLGIKRQLLDLESP